MLRDAQFNSKNMISSSSHRLFLPSFWGCSFHSHYWKVNSDGRRQTMVWKYLTSSVVGWWLDHFVRYYTVVFTCLTTAQMETLRQHEKKIKKALRKFKVFSIPSFNGPKNKPLLFLIECIVHLDIVFFFLIIITMKKLKRKTICHRKTICYSYTSISNKVRSFFFIFN